MTGGTSPTRAMVLAAGQGKRMRPLTETTPKCLVEVGGRALLDRALDSLERAGVECAVVNTHHLADQVEAHLSARRTPRIVISREDAALETGGGVARALPELGEAPFFVANADVVVLDGVCPALARLAESWRDETMDALLLMHLSVRAFGYDGLGDYVVGACGELRRRREREVAPWMFTGVQVLHPRLFAGHPGGAFSLNRLYDRAESAGRLYGIVHDGAILHVGTMATLADADRYLRELD